LSTTVTVCVEVAVLFPSVVRSKLLCLVLSLNLLVNVLLLPLYNYRKRLERLIENWHRYKLPSLHYTDCCQGGYSWNLIVTTKFVLKWPYCYFHQLRSRLLCLVLSPNLLVNVTVTVVQLSEALERLIENCHRYKLPSLHYT
jgi:hypothetical protein